MSKKRRKQIQATGRNDTSAMNSPTRSVRKSALRRYRRAHMKPGGIIRQDVEIRF